MVKIVDCLHGFQSTIVQEYCVNVKWDWVWYNFSVQNTANGDNMDALKWVVVLFFVLVF